MNMLNTANTPYVIHMPVSVYSANSITHVKRVMLKKFHVKRAYPWNLWIKVSVNTVMVKINKRWSMSAIFYP